MSQPPAIRFIASILLTAAVAVAQDAPPPERPDPPQPAGAKKAAATAGTPIYDEQADAKEQIAAALARARKENQRVLIQWGGNWCPWCIKLHELYKSNSQVARTLLYEYVVVYVDAGRPAGKNVELARSYGADLAKHGYPFLTILDADGKPLANQDTASLEIDGADITKGHDPQKLMALLVRHQAERRQARQVLADGLDKARSAGKRVFLHFGAPWCVWCHRLEDWMARPEIHAILDKDFVDVKIDIDRMAGGKEELARFVGSDGSGIPWFAFLDADGKTLATSDPGGGGNIGFPATDPEIEHFQKMLASAARNLTPADAAALATALREAEKARKAAAKPPAP